MPRRVPLGPELPDAFRSGAGGAHGFTRGRLRGRDLVVPFYGVRRRASEEADPLRTLRDYAPLLRPGDRFSHQSAALLWNAPLPRTSADLHVTASGAGQPRSRGVVGHRGPPGAVLRTGLPASDPVRLFLELAAVLDLDDLVAVGDHLVLDPWLFDPRDPRPFSTPDALRAASGEYRGRGACAARRACELVRVGAESRPETLLRLLLCRTGIREPELGVDVQDRGGRWIGRFDLVWRHERVIVEYDGDQHRSSRDQYEKDMRRLDRATDAGWRVIRVRARGLFRDPQGTVDRVRVTLARACVESTRMAS